MLVTKLLFKDDLLLPRRPCIAGAVTRWFLFLLNELPIPDKVSIFEPEKA